MKKNNQCDVFFKAGYYFKLSLFLLILTAFCNVNAQQKITGTVVDNSNMPMPGVNIIVKGTTTGTMTDFDGNFSIEASNGDSLVFTYVGMKTTSVLVQDKTKIVVILETDNELLDEVVVVGYGTQKKSDVISSVTSVKPEDMVKVATTDIGEMLRGKAAGVQVTLSDGGPGSSSNILIRGKNSINGGNNPIVIADGVPIGDINDINPNDIASLEILKDAAAQAIYGARASNGVILITTKRGKEGKITVSYNGSSGVQTINRNFDIYSGDEFAQLKREAFRGSNLGVYQPDEAIFSALELASVQSGEYIDWEKEIIGTGTTQNHNLSISSGTENTSVYTSLNYLNLKGVVKNSDYNKVTARLNVDQKISDWLKIGLNTSFQFSNENRPNVSNVLLNSITTSPLGKIYNDDGSLRYLPGGFEENKNPLIDLAETNSLGENRNDIINVFMDISPFKGFNYRLNTSRRSWNGKARSYNSTKSISGISSGGLGNGSIQFQDNVEWQIENILTYKTDFSSDAKHNLNLTAVHSVTESKYNSYINIADNIPNDILGIYGLEAAETNTPFISGNRRGLVSFVARAEYDFSSEYYVTVSGRADASTVFGSENKWGFFPAAAIGWNVHKESFISDVEAINNLKLRFSYGSVGNEAIAPYQSLSSATQRDYIINGVKVSGYVPGDFLPNPDLKWETSTTFNTALDLGLWKNRLTTTVEFYNTRTKDLLIDQALNAGLGYKRKKTNLGEIENQGIEVSLNGAIVRKEDFKINLGLIFSKNDNKIISLYGLDEDGDGIEDDDVGNGWFIGQPIDVYYRYKPIGIFQEGEDIISTHQPNAVPGDVKLYDRYPDDGILNAEDRVITQRGPDWIGTLNLDMEYKEIDFSTNITTVQGAIKDNPFLYGYTEGGSLRGIKNGIKQYYWTPEDPGGDFPRPNEANDPTQLISKGLQDASYIRLQNVTLGYTLPKDMLSTLGLNKLRLYVTGSNLFTITDFESYSPEKNPNEYPEAVSVVMGLQVSF
ncbi:TonB-linked outer membrane protein, SusC/RagA family [Flaviramulus basaltis]|uniref:TonB-linked outer membrane protein, SusC/RagA family n=1 Tax=Flaviramulus basaltis TaxID=369401 RepID=A0A1K2IRG3_9FLAO|nr:TonB-dependent receptor [Flaviramulus basaltis]SFZ95029.1 TonB-linked outer membrane protein, SusC/RagA family [Flaviramulus basaltis]